MKKLIISVLIIATSLTFFGCVNKVENKDNKPKQTVKEKIKKNNEEDKSKDNKKNKKVSDKEENTEIKKEDSTKNIEKAESEEAVKEKVKKVMKEKPNISAVKQMEEPKNDLR